MNGPLAGEMVTEVRFAGVSQGEGAKTNFLIRRLQRLPFVFNIRIKAPFRGLLDSAQSFYDPKRLIGATCPRCSTRQNNAAEGRVQPPASEKRAMNDTMMMTRMMAAIAGLAGLRQRLRAGQADRDQPQHQRDAGSRLSSGRRGQVVDPAEPGDILMNEVCF